MESWFWHACVIMAFVLLAFGAIGYYLGKPKGRADTGCWLGFFFGPIGWVIVALLPGERTTHDERPSDGVEAP